MHLFVIPTWVHIAFLGWVLVAAWVRGGRCERFAAITLLVWAFWGWYVCRVWTCWVAAPSAVMTWPPVLNDVALLAACVACAWRDSRYWAIWASSFALLQVVTDVVGHVASGLTVWAVASANIVWFYLLGAAVLWGVLGSTPTSRRRVTA